MRTLFLQASFPRVQSLKSLAVFFFDIICKNRRKFNYDYMLYMHVMNWIVHNFETGNEYTYIYFLSALNNSIPPTT